ncbi:MAG: rod shape-determining protein MreC [Patescibacteria group bacterium]|nr:rod shape-determining protein MreC [Patescibacteria group bacterium]
MAYLLKNNKNKSGKKRWLFFSLILLLMLSFYFGGLFIFTEPLHYVGRPVWFLKNYSMDAISSFTTAIKTKKNLTEENESLRDELSRINSKFLLLKLLEKENYELKTMLGRKDEDQEFILANILAKPNLSPYDSLILDIGKSEGAKKGAKVLINDNIILGELEEVYSKTSKVRMYSFPSDKLEVAVGFNKIIGTAEGKGGGNFEIKFPRDVIFEKGDVVVLPDMDLLILGTVESILTTPEDPLQTLLFRIPINIFELRWVQILQE